MRFNTKMVSVFIFIILTVLSACDGATDKSEKASEESSPSAAASSNSTDDPSQQKSESSDLNDDTTIEKQETENQTSNNAEVTVDAKDEYRKKLNNANQETEGLKAKDSSTYALKEVENKRWDIWDELLNEIYGELQDQLPPEKMSQLREEQRNWIEIRDKRALEASQKYKGGTQEHLEYVSVLANVTEERCYELVEEYMS